MKKRALIIGGGGMRGAYDGGAATTFCRELGSDYFDAIYACSAGAYTAAYFALNQPDAIENLWRNYLHGGKFTSLLKPFYGRYISDLEYLTYLMQNRETILSIENLSQIQTLLQYAITDRESGKPVYVQPTQENIFNLLTASSAMPLGHPPVAINGVRYIDGVLSDPLPFAKALADGYEEVVVIFNKPKGFFVGDRYDTFSRMFALCLPRMTAYLLKTLKTRFQDIERELAKEKRLKVIRPKVQLPLKSILDSNKARLNACVDMGIADAKEFLKTYRST